MHIPGTVLKPSSCGDEEQLKKWVLAAQTSATNCKRTVRRLVYPRTGIAVEGLETAVSSNFQLEVMVLTCVKKLTPCLP